MRKSALYWLGLVVTALVALGLIVLSSASEANSARLHHGDSYFFMRRQFEYLGVAIVAAFIAAKFDYHKWRNGFFRWGLLIFVLVLLVAVFGFPAVNGSHRWIRLGPVRLQASEFAKLATVIIVASWMDKIGWRVELFVRGVLVPGMIIGIIALPILAEPDFGSVVVVGLVGCLVMFVAGSKLLHMLPLVLAGAACVVYKVATNANRMSRLFDDEKLYQVRMALAAIGNGGIEGVGLGQSMQKHLYLPEAHTDFVFAVGAEELGLVFSIVVVLLFCAFFVLSIHIASKASDRLGKFLVIGMAFIIFFQAMFNIGVVCKALPTKGMALPFFSYGGTNLVSSFMAIGTIFSVGIQACRERKRQFVTKVLKRG